MYQNDTWEVPNLPPTLLQAQSENELQVQSENEDEILLFDESGNSDQSDESHESDDETTIQARIPRQLAFLGRTSKSGRSIKANSKYM